MILAQNEDLADVLVIDQTNNPGGNADYLNRFASLFATDKFFSYGQYYHADRKWLHDLRENYDKLKKTDFNLEESQRLLLISDSINKAIDAKQEFTSDPYPFTGSRFIQPDAEYVWKKPILVLVDELTGSCGDIFPMMMKSNKRAKLFGQRTMGLGGSVEAMDALTYSRLKVKLTRGLLLNLNVAGKYIPSDYVENNGIQPDFVHKISVTDFHQGYTDYIKAFLAKAEELAELEK